MQGKIIALIGIAGTGKTTLGQNLNKSFGVDFLEENWKDILFVSGERAKKATSFEVCVGFLNMRYAQIKKAESLKKEGKVVFIDTIFEMTNVYAQQMLDVEEYAEYRKIYDIYVLNIPKPDLYVYLNGEIEVIRQRAIDRHWGINLEETLLSMESLTKAKEGIDDLLKDVSKEKILEIDVTKSDIREQGFLKEIFQSIF